MALAMDEDYRPRNREKARQARRISVWCVGCDACLVSESGKGRKCPVCGNNHGKIHRRFRYT